MSQMSPINWLYLMYFILFMMTIVFIYYLYMSMVSEKNNFFVMNKCLIWKW